MNAFKRTLKIVDIVGILRKISKLCVNGVGRAALTVILGNKRASLKGTAVQTEEFTSDIRREIVAFQIGVQILQMKFIRLLRRAEGSADAVTLAAMLEIHFSAVHAPLPGTVHHALLVKSTGFSLGVKAVKHDTQKCSQRTLAPGIGLMDHIEPLSKFQFKL